LKGGIFCNNNYLYDDIENDKISIALPSLPHLQGFHNKENIAIVYIYTRYVSHFQFLAQLLSKLWSALKGLNIECNILVVIKI
jgi:hypothetical protein